MSKKSFIKNIKIFLLIAFVCSIIIYLFIFFLGRQVSGYKKINDSRIQALEKQIEAFDGVKRVDIYFTRPSINIDVYPDKTEISDNTIDLIFDLVEETINYQLVYEINERSIQWNWIPDVRLRFNDYNGGYKDLVGSSYSAGGEGDPTETIIWDEWYIFKR